MNDKLRLEGKELDEWMEIFLTVSNIRFSDFDYSKLTKEEIIKNVKVNIIRRIDFEESMNKIIKEK